MKEIAILFIGMLSSVTFAAGQYGPVAPLTLTPPKTLLEAISIAVKHNPKTVALDELLVSIHYATLATQASRRIRGSLSCSAHADWSQSDFNGSRQRMIQTLSQSCGIGASVTLFDGEAGRYRTKAAQAGEAAAEATYNTADSRFSNTRGGLAYETKQIFTSIAEANESLNFYRQYLGILYEFKKVSNDNNLLAFIVNVEQLIAQFESNLSLLISDFRYIVTVDPSPELDDLDEAIVSLKIPASVDEAVKIALGRGPEVIRRNLNVEMAEYNLLADKANLGPFISLGANLSQGRYQIGGTGTNTSTYKSAGVGLTMTLQLDPAGHYRVQSSKEYLASQKSERAAALADAEQSIRSTYASLTSNHRLYAAHKKNFDDQLVYVQTIVDKIHRGDISGLDITHLLTDVRILDQRFSNVSNVQQSILASLFSIQQVTGLLFDNIGAQPQIRTVF